MSLTAAPPLETINLVNPSLEEAYVHVGGAKIHVTVHIPDEFTDDTKRFLIGDGYFSRERNYTELAKSLSRLGHVAITHQPADKQDIFKRTHPSHWDGVKLSCEALDAGRKFTNRVLELDPSSKYIVAGHSLGAYTGAKFTEYRPDKVEQLVLIAAAGMEQHDLPEMLERTGQIVMTHFPDLAYEFGINPMKFMYSSTMHVLETFGSPSKFDRRFREGYTAVYCNTKPYIHKAKQAGIPVEIVCFEDDAYSKLKENVRAANETNSNLYILPGDHFTPQKEPVRFASDLDNIVKDRYVRL